MGGVCAEIIGWGVLGMCEEQQGCPGLLRPVSKSDAQACAHIGKLECPLSELPLGWPPQLLQQASRPESLSTLVVLSAGGSSAHQGFPQMVQPSRVLMQHHSPWLSGLPPLDIHPKGHFPWHQNGIGLLGSHKKIAQAS